MVGVVLLPVCSTLHHWGDLSWQVCLDPGDCHHHHHHCYQHINSNININMISTIISIHLVPTSPEGHVQMPIIIVMKIKLTTNYSPWHYHQHEAREQLLVLGFSFVFVGFFFLHIANWLYNRFHIRHLCLFRKMRYQLLPSHFDCHSVFLRTSNENWCSG